MMPGLEQEARHLNQTGSSAVKMEAPMTKMSPDDLDAVLVNNLSGTKRH